MKIIESYLTKNPCYNTKRTIKVKGLMLHSVGCNQPSAKAFVNYWNDPSYNRACVHAFIDANTGDVYQCLPWNHRGWHGGGSSNDTHIGVEMCEPSEMEYVNGGIYQCKDVAKAKALVKRTYESAVELFAFLCDQYNLNPLTDICSHAEGYKFGIASNHGDPEHIWNWLHMGYTMDGFRKAVKARKDGLNNTSINTYPTTEATSMMIFYALKQWIGNDYGVCGLMGNLEAESSFRFNNLQDTYQKKWNISDDQYTKEIDSGSRSFLDSAGYGLAQWTYGKRKANLLAYAKSNNKSIADPTMQLNFIHLEIIESYPNLLQILQSAESVKQASDAVLSMYEVPADMSDKVKNYRASLGEMWYNKYAKYPATPFLINTTQNSKYYKNPSISGNASYSIGKGIFTITKVSNGFGKLKSGIGWVNLDDSVSIRI